MFTEKLNGRMILSLSKSNKQAVKTFKFSIRYLFGFHVNLTESLIFLKLPCKISEQKKSLL